MTVSEAYWQRAKILTQGRGGKEYIVYESDDPVIGERAQTALAKLGLAVDDDSCSHLGARLGKARYEYRLCELKISESK